jgi:peptidyl-tRNA hydrolase, PTH1 family
LGLGNPGNQYIDTRHNVGFRVVDLISEITRIGLKKHLFEEFERGKGVYNSKQVALVKPLTYMNNSGRVIRQILKWNNATIDDLIVICDHLDLPAGVCRLKIKGSSGGHKGLASIISYAGTQEFKRLYIGIGRPEHPDDVIDYVLARPKGNDKRLIEEGITKAAQHALMLLERDPEALMNIINRRD